MKPKAFPRGRVSGESVLTALELREINERAAREVGHQELFESEKPDTKAAAAGKRKRSTPAATAGKNARVQDDDEVVGQVGRHGAKRHKATRDAAVHMLNYKQLVVGMSLLGVVREINDLDMVISLPNQLTGFLSIAEVSDHLTCLLENVAMAEGEDDAANTNTVIPSLSHFFRVGQIFPCVIIGIEEGQNAGKAKHRVELSCRTELVNADLKKDGLQKGMTLLASVKSVEDHGYSVSFGVGDVTGFLHKDRVNIADLLKIARSSALEFSALKPGFLLEGRIARIQPNGLEINFSDGLKGYVDAFHLGIFTSEPLDAVFKPNEKIVALTLNDGLLKLSEDQPEVSYGDVVEPAVVVRVDNNHGVVFRCGDSLYGFAHVSKLTDTPIVEVPQSKFAKGSSHKVRVIGFDLCDGVVQLSLQPSVLNASFLRKADVKPGVVVKLIKATVTKIEPFGLIVAINDSISALVHKSELSEIASASVPKFYKIGSVIKCRALAYDKVNQRLTLTAKKPLVNSTLPPIVSYESAEVGMITHGSIASVKEFGCIVTFYNNVRAIVPLRELADRRIKDPAESFSIGMVVKCRVLSVDAEGKKMTVSFKPAKKKKRASGERVQDPIDPKVETLDDLTTGQLVKARVKSVTPTLVHVTLGSNLNGRVHISEVFDSVDDVVELGSIYKPRKTYDFKVTGFYYASKAQRFVVPSDKFPLAKTVVELSSSRFAAKDAALRDFPSLVDIEVGSTYDGFVLRASPDGVYICVGPRVLGRAPLLDCSDDVDVLTNYEEHFRPGKAVKCRVISKDVTTTELNLSLRDESVFINSVRAGMVLAGKVTKIIPATGAFVQLRDGMYGRANLADIYSGISDDPLADLKINSFVQCRVIQRSPKGLLVSVGAESSSEVAPDINVHGFIKNISDNGLFVDVGRGRVARVRIKEIFDEYVKDWKAGLNVGQRVFGKIISVDPATNRLEMSLRRSVTNPGNELKFSSLKKGMKVSGAIKNVTPYGVFIKIDNSKLSGLCYKTELADKEVLNIESLYRVGDVVKAIVLSVDSEKEKFNLGLKASYFDAADLDDDGEQDEEAQLDDDDDDGMSVTMVGNGDAMEIEDADGEDKYNVANGEGSDPDVHVNAQSTSLDIGWSLEAEEDPDIASDADDGEEEGDKFRTSKKEKRRQKVAAEERTRNDEQMLRSSKAPESEKDFERLLLGSPNSSFLWIKYMAFHLHASEVAKARAVADKALKTISFRENQELLNVWVAFLNLENSFGDEASLTRLFNRAVSFNEPKAMFLQMARIYSRNLKVVCKFAQMEFKFGEAERGRTLFEGVLSNHPKRLDMWSIYLDMESRGNNIDAARRLFERAITLKLSTKKMKFLFKKYLEFEKQRGSAEGMAHVKDAALKYASFVVTPTA
ncbi:rRNA biogenesis protein rrp5 [Irineochytrium annulatum]|nr:rRNA biogenesis protein rrp5 [Irineochytrium annulatum]